MKSITEINIRFSDIDMAGHVHNSKYLCYFELGRIDFLSKIAGKEWNWKQNGIVLAKNELDYLSPIYLTDKVYVVTKCDQIGNKSFILSYEIHKSSKEKDILCSIGKSTLVCINYENNTTVPVYEQWKEYLAESIEAR